MGVGPKTYQLKEPILTKRLVKVTFSNLPFITHLKCYHYTSEYGHYTQKPNERTFFIFSQCTKQHAPPLLP